MSNNFDELLKMTNEAQSVIQMIEALGCAELEDGCFYRTFNDSLVYVTCVKPHCQVNVQIPDFIKDLIGDKLDDIIAEKIKEKEEAHMWKAMVIEGGHKIKEIIGECKGEVYFLDDKSCFDLGEKNRRFIQALSMSLRKKLCHYNDINQLKIGSADGIK